MAAGQPLVPSIPVPVASPVVFGVQRRRRRKRHSPVCHGTVKGRTVGDDVTGSCAGCLSDLADEGRGWDCRACSFSQCGACAPLAVPPAAPSQEIGPVDELQVDLPGGVVATSPSVEAVPEIRFKRGQSRKNGTCGSCSLNPHRQKWGFNTLCCNMWVCSAPCRSQQLSNHQCISSAPLGSSPIPSPDLRSIVDLSVPAEMAAEVDGMELSALLDEAAAGPALTTLPRMPVLFGQRFGELLKECLLADACAQQVQARASNEANVAEARKTTQRLWLLSSLTCRLNGLGVDDGKQQSKLLRARFQLLEQGDWLTALKQYVVEKRLVDAARRQQAVADVTAVEQVSTVRRHEKLTEKAMRGKVAVARVILEGEQKAPPTAETAIHVAALAAAVAPDFRGAGF